MEQKVVFVGIDVGDVRWCIAPAKPGKFTCGISP